MSCRKLSWKLVHIYSWWVWLFKAHFLGVQRTLEVCGGLQGLAPGIFTSFSVWKRTTHWSLKVLQGKHYCWYREGNMHEYEHPDSQIIMPCGMKFTSAWWILHHSVHSSMLYHHGRASRLLLSYSLICPHLAPAALDSVSWQLLMSCRVSENRWPSLLSWVSSHPQRKFHLNTSPASGRDLYNRWKCSHHNKYDQYHWFTVRCAFSVFVKHSSWCVDGHCLLSSCVCVSGF